MLETNITKIGGSLYVLVPEFLVKYFDLKNGDKVKIKIDNEQAVIIIEKKRERNAVC